MEDGHIIRARPRQEKREFYPLTSPPKNLLVVELTCGLLSESVIQSQSAHH